MFPIVKPGLGKNLEELLPFRVKHPGLAGLGSYVSLSFFGMNLLLSELRKWPLPPSSFADFAAARLGPLPTTYSLATAKNVT